MTISTHLWFLSPELQIPKKKYLEISTEIVARFPRYNYIE